MLTEPGEVMLAFEQVIAQYPDVIAENALQTFALFDCQVSEGLCLVFDELIAGHLE
jgi:hypothetical protein